MSGPGSVEAAAAVALTPTPFPQAGEGVVAVAMGNTAQGVPTALVDTVATTDGSLPCAQWAVGEGCAPLAAGSSPAGLTQASSAAVATSLPPPNLPLRAGEGAKSAIAHHTATVAHPAKPQTFAKPADGPGVGGALFALVLVVGLILGLGWLARRMPGVGRASGSGALRVVGSLTLGPRDRVVVVEVGTTQLLIGVGQHGMTTLHTLSEPLPVAQTSQGTPSLQDLATPFAQLLAKHLGKKP